MAGAELADGFYIQDTWEEKLTGRDRIDRLKQILLN
jgi:hypothetical protein